MSVFLLLAVSNLAWGINEITMRSVTEILGASGKIEKCGFKMGLTRKESSENDILKTLEILSLGRKDETNPDPHLTVNFFTTYIQHGPTKSDCLYGNGEVLCERQYEESYGPIFPRVYCYNENLTLNLDPHGRILDMDITSRYRNGPCSRILHRTPVEILSWHCE